MDSTTRRQKTRKKMNRPPAFQFYPKDWLDFRVQRMSLEAQGAYLKLLCFMWADSDDQCSIIDNNDLLARALGTAVEHWLELRTEIQCATDAILEEKNGRLVSARLKSEAIKQRKYRKQQSEKGELSARMRVNRGSTAVEPEHQPEGNSSSSLKETKKESVLPQNSRSSEKPKSRKLRALVPLPDHFAISDDVWDWTTKHEYKRAFVEREFGRFCDHNRSHAGKFADWDAAFRNWLLKAEEIAASRNGHFPPKSNGPSPHQRERIPL